MVLTLSRCLDHVQHALHGRNPSAQVAPLEIVNTAGKHVCSTFGWGFLERPPADLNLVSGQSYVTLPTDVGAVLDIQSQNTASAFKFLGTGTLSKLQTYGVNDTVTYGMIVNDTTGRPRLEVWPVPNANETAALRLYYRAGWTDLTDDDTDTVPFPSFMDALILQVIRAFALGWEEDESLDARLEQIEQGRIFMAACEADQGMQNDFGKLEGGCVGPRPTRRATNWSPWGVDDP